MKVKSLSRVLLVSFILLLLAFISLWQVQQVSLAQGGTIGLSKTLNRTSNVVRVGEVLSFTIVLTNNSTFSLTQVTLIDDYNQNVMRYAGASRTPDTFDPTIGEITWDVAPVLPNQTITVTLAFTAEHPQTAVVNYARAEDLIWSDNSIGQSAETSRTQDAIGGAAPIFKSLHPPDSVPIAGLPITFTHVITNDGAAAMTRLPLSDTYGSDYLEFNYAVPPPDLITQSGGTGLLVWTNLITSLGLTDLPPFATVVVTTVFTATTRVVDGVNQASTEGAIDVYNNDLTAGATQVPITIIETMPAATATPTRQDDDDDEDEEEETAPIATATPFPTQTSTVITTTETGPLYLPETGWRPVYKFIFPVLGMMLLALGWMLVSDAIKKTD